MDDAVHVLHPDKDLADVQGYLSGTDSRWKIIGIQLKIPISFLENIEKECKGIAEECNLKMQIEWLKSKRATWKSLVEVLRKLSDGFEEKARAIEKERLSPCNSDTDFQITAEHVKHSQQNVLQPQQQFLTEHLEWLLRIGFSLEKIVEWIKTKNQVQILEDFTHQDDHSGENESAGDANNSPNYDHGHESMQLHNIPCDGSVTGTHRHTAMNTESNSLSSASVMTEVKSKKRPRATDKSGKLPSKKKPRQRSESLSPIQFSLIDAPTERRKQLQIKNNMLQIIKKLKKNPDGREFINFVKEENAKDYYKIIDYPMCLNEIRDRINRNQCDTREDFCSEFQDIVDNCIKYNGKDSDYSAQVMRLKDHFDDLVKSYLPKDGILRRLPPPEKELPKVKPGAKGYNLEESSSDDDQDYIPGNEESQESQESVIGNMEERMISENGYLESSHDSSLSQSVADEGSPTKSPAAQVSESFKNGSQTHDIVGTSARTHPKTIGADSVTMNDGVNEDSDDEPPPINWS